MQELPYGGWVAPNIYYLGYAGGLHSNFTVKINLLSALDKVDFCNLFVQIFSLILIKKHFDVRFSISGVVEFNGLRIAGLSGIYKGIDYLKGRYEYPPYDQSTMRSVYHIRNLDAFRLRQLKVKPGKNVIKAFAFSLILFDTLAKALVTWTACVTPFSNIFG